MEVTVVIPLYNKQDTVARCLRSVFAQTKSVAQVIVVNDRSTDRSLDVVNAAARPELRVCTLPANLGPGAARNAGTKMAATEWVAFIDADDAWQPSFLEEVCDAIARANADFGSSGRWLHRIRAPGQPQESRKLLVPDEDQAALRDPSRAFWWMSLRFDPINSSCAVVRRSLLLDVGGFPEHVRNMEDLQLWARLWLHGTFAFVNKALIDQHMSWDGLASGRRPSRPIAVYALALSRVLLSAWRQRKPGSGWLFLYLLRFLLLAPPSWAASNLRHALRG